MVSLSGGRTSGYMLRRILDAHGGTLPPDVRVVFANTGEEHPGTLDFVQSISDRWNVPVTWLEYDPKAEGFYRVVTHATGSREGEPLTDLAIHRHDRSEGVFYLPNAIQRICTGYLKMFIFGAWMRAIGYGEMGDWQNIVGLRADEPKRLADLRKRNEKGEDNYAPLGVAVITKADVMAFWAAQPFDLPDFGVKPWEGNCQMCFLKGIHQRIRVARDHPEVAARWQAREEMVGASHDKKYPVAAIRARAELPMIPGLGDGDDELLLAEESARIPCTCHD